jgi:limonene-1,2-epoxide hydrolase
MTNHEETIRNYYAAWVRDDLDAVFALCTEDVTAVNVPIGPIHGKKEVRAFFEKFGKGMTQKRYDVERILVSGDAAVVEGVENYLKKGRAVSLPYMSVFKFEGGKIREWRDYFDIQTILRQLGLPLDGSRPASAPAASVS